MIHMLLSRNHFYNPLKLQFTPYTIEIVLRVRIHAEVHIACAKYIHNKVSDELDFGEKFIQFRMVLYFYIQILTEPTQQMKN